MATSATFRVMGSGFDGTYPRRLGPAPMPTGSAASVYQATDRSAVRQITFTNTTSGDLQVTVHIVPVGDSPDIGNRLISSLTIPGADTNSVKVAFVMNPGEHVYALATGAVNIMFNIYDREPGWL